MSIGRHTLANLAGWAVPMAVAIATVPHYIAYIGQERFGVLAVIWTILNYFNFVDFGFGRAVTQRLARMANQLEAERSRLVWTGLLASVFLAAAASAAVYAVAAYLLSTQIKMSPAMRAEAVATARWLAIALPLVLPGSVLLGALQARLRFLQANFSQSLGNVASQIVPLALAAAGRIELWYLVPAVLLTKASANLMLYMQCKKHVPLIGAPTMDMGLLRSMFGYGGWVSVMNLVGPLLVVVDRLVIGTLTGARSVTHYTVPYDLVSKGTVLSGSLSSALFPRVASASDAAGRALAKDAVTVLIAVMTPITIAGLLCFHPFLILWVGTELAQASAGVGEIILLGVWINCIAVPYYSRTLAIGDAKAVASLYLVELPVYFVMLWYGVDCWGVLGAAGAWAFRVALDTALLLRLNTALKTIALQVMPSFALVVCAFGLRFASRPVAQTALLGGLLLAASLYINKSMYKRILRSIARPSVHAS